MGDVLTANCAGLGRPRYAVGVCASVLLLPAFLLRGMGPGGAGSEFDVSSGAATVSTPSTWLSPSRIVAEPSSPSSASPLQVRASVPPLLTTLLPATSTSAVSVVTTRVPPTPTTVLVTTTTVVSDVKSLPASSAAAPRPTTTVATTTVAATTTTTRYLVSLPALAPITPAGKAPTQSDRGLASWYHAPDRTCAHRTVPKGVVIKVTRASTGESTMCAVADWGPADTSRVIDLSMDTFERLAHADSGLMEVLIEW